MSIPIDHHIPSTESQNKNSRLLVRLAIWASLAVMISGLERLIPFPVPWVRLGLANGVTLLVLLGVGAGPALIVSLLRIFIVGAIFGTWLSPVFLISLSGGLVSYSVMVSLKMMPGNRFSAVGLSVAGAFSHMLTQFIFVAFLIMRNTAIFTLVGPSLVLSIISGVIVGIIVQITFRKIPKRLLFPK